MTRVLLITGDHPRHLHAAVSIASVHEIAGWIIEEREPIYPQSRSVIPLLTLS